MAADETSTTGPGAVSKDGPQPVPAPTPEEQIPEAHIIEETVIKPAPLPESRPKAAEVAPQDGHLLTGSALIPNLSSAPSPLVPEVQEPEPLAEPPHDAKKSEKEQAVISQILKEIKLPERREPPGDPLAKEQPRVFDTILGAPPTSTEIVSDDVVGHEEKVASRAQSLASSTPTLQSASRLAEIVAPLRTLKNDLQEIVRVKKISLVRAAALESDKRGRSNILGGEVVRAHSHRTFGMLFAAGLLVLLGAAGLFGIYVIYRDRSPQQRAPLSSILFAESALSFPLEGGSPLELKRSLAQTREASATLGSITHIIPLASEASPEGANTLREARLEEFLTALGSRASPELLRALAPEFFFGIHTVDENAPLMVIPVLSYERAFAGMLSWEASMNADLSPIFTPVPDQVIGASGLPEKRRFEDVVMRNYDVRVLKDDAGVVQLYYCFPTQRLLIIAESPYTFTEVISRLRAERKL
ncbi:hypothetical protein HY478_00490 [Candidatus Uhrbacteria bacterium]|nr:hypothetical protein [Candidatus Uhrbacteria bacterium]